MQSCTFKSYSIGAQADSRTPGLQVAGLTLSSSVKPIHASVDFGDNGTGWNAEIGWTGFFAATLKTATPMFWFPGSGRDR